MKKLIDLDECDVALLNELAKGVDISCKRYIERVLIRHVAEYSQAQIDPRLLIKPITPAEALKSRPIAKVESEKSTVSELSGDIKPELKPFEQVSRNLNGKREPLVRQINRGVPVSERKNELDPEAIANMVKSNIKAKPIIEAAELEPTKHQPKRKTLDELGVKTVTGRRASEVIK